MAPEWERAFSRKSPASHTPEHDVFDGIDAKDLLVELE